MKPLTKKKCSCGLLITSGQQARHELGHWHLQHAEAIALRAQGLTFADIARHLGWSRAYVSQKFGLLVEPA